LFAVYFFAVLPFEYLAMCGGVFLLCYGVTMMLMKIELLVQEFPKIKGWFNKIMQT